MKLRKFSITSKAIELNNGEEIERFESMVISEIESHPDMRGMYLEKLKKIDKKYSKISIEQKKLPLRKYKIVSRELLESLKEKIKIIIFTATEVEKFAVLKHIKPFKGEDCIICGHVEAETYYIGCLGLYNVILLMCKPGSIQRDSIIISSQKAFQFWELKIALLCGIAFGLQEKKHKLGDILISEEIVSYEVERKGKRSVHRGETLNCSLILKSRFKNEIGWSYQLPDGKFALKIFGQILSGEKLVDNKKFRRRLIKDFPNAIGGEMEGAGLGASASREKVEWILIKAICDWGYKKKKDFQKYAAESSISLVHHILNLPFIFEELGIRSNCLNSNNKNNRKLNENLPINAKQLQKDIKSFRKNLDFIRNKGSESFITRYYSIRTEARKVFSNKSFNKFNITIFQDLINLMDIFINEEDDNLKKWGIDILNLLSESSDLLKIIRSDCFSKFEYLYNQKFRINELIDVLDKLSYFPDYSLKEIIKLIIDKDVKYLRTFVHNLYYKEIKLDDDRKEEIIDEICRIKSDLDPSSSKTHKDLINLANEVLNILHK